MCLGGDSHQGATEGMLSWAGCTRVPDVPHDRQREPGVINGAGLTCYPRGGAGRGGGEVKFGSPLPACTDVNSKLICETTLSVEECEGIRKPHRRLCL